MFNQKKEQKKMKKFWNLMLAALVIFGAVACTENQEENIPQTEQKAVLSFVANIANDETRTHIEKNEDEGVWETKWDGDETLYINGYAFTNSVDQKNVFNCYTEGVEELLGTEVYVQSGNYFDSKAGMKGAFLFAHVENFDPTTTISLDVQTSFFHFTSTSEVTLTANDYSIFEYENGSHNTVTLPAGEHWVAFLPYDNCTFSYSVNGYKVKEITKDFEVKKIYNLGTIGKSEYGVVGSFQAPTTWDVAAPVAMYTEGDWVVAKNVELYKSEEIKIIKGNSWDVNYGLDNTTALAVDTQHTIKKGGANNIQIAKNGKFDIYFNPTATSNNFKYTCVEEYTDLMVNITINNKANWSPLYITLKDGDTVVADNATVTNNKYQVSGEYIGKTLTCTLSNGTKTSEVMNVAITKTGATVTLEETIIKLKVQLNTANAKQWWGSTMKIHVWDTGTSFDTSWPGNAMTSEGNYTWSIIVPSELVGKTIKYLVHNGNGWQSKDSTVTISAEGNTVTGSSIGIN